MYECNSSTTKISLLLWCALSSILESLRKSNKCNNASTSTHGWIGISETKIKSCLQSFSGQNIARYILLAVTYLTLFCCQKHRQSLCTVFKRRGIQYFFLAVVDVESNYLIHRAFQYTTLTSVQVSRHEYNFFLKKKWHCTPTLGFHCALCPLR